MIGNIRYLPILLMMRPVTIDITSTPPIIGSICMPASEGVEYFTTCRYIGRNVTEPNSDTPTIKPIALDSRNVRSRKSSSGMIGSTARRSS